jgi:hypothetical protein
MATSKVIWTIKELTEVLRARQLNKFDVDFGVSGKRGDGKSTLLFKIFNSWSKTGFNQEEHQEYSQQKIIELLSSQKFGFCWDDEAINSGYKRDFQKTGQKNLIKIITNYRDNFNIYGSALPFFYSLDKDLRELMFMHIHIIERGIAVILIPLQDQIHSQDPWDTKRNQDIEKQEYARIERNPELKFRYHRFTTFAGYLYFGDMTDKQRKLYEEIKSRKRQENFVDSGVLSTDKKNKSFADMALEQLIDNKLTRDGLIQACLLNGQKFSSVQSQLNNMLKDKGIIDKTVRDFLITTHSKGFHSNDKGQINDLIPDL